MGLGNILFFLCLPALIWNAPLISAGPIDERASFSPWDLLKFENLSYDNITALIETVEYGSPNQFFDGAAGYEVLNFVTSLARNGISSWDTEAQEELERDIEWLFSDEDEDNINPWWSFSSWAPKEFSIAFAILRSDEKVEAIQCKSWLSKKWEKTKKYVKKHKKPILIAAAVVVVATVVIVATGGAGAAPIAGAAATAGAASSSSDNKDRPHINKPGDVRVQDEKPPQENSQKDPSPASRPTNNSNAKEPSLIRPQLETVVDNQHIGKVAEALQYHSEVIKETLSEELPSEALNVPPKEEATFWQSAAGKTKEVTSWIAHDVLKDTAEWVGVSNETAYQYHEKIDEAFGTDYASQYTPEALENQPNITKGLLPPPGGGLATTAKRAAAIDRGTGIATGAAAAGSALTKGSPLPAPSQTPINSRYIDPTLPKDPQALLKDSSWVETTHPKAAENGHRVFENRKTGEQLSYDEAKSGEPGHKGRSHWHRHNPNTTSDRDKYLDAKGNPVANGSSDSHLYPPE